MFGNDITAGQGRLPKYLGGIAIITTLGRRVGDCERWHPTRPVTSAQNLKSSALPPRKTVVNRINREAAGKLENRVVEVNKYKARRLAEKKTVTEKVDPNADGNFQLNPLMSRVLDDELQQLMSKVWQTLPDEPPTDAEKLVADKFRSDAGDEIKNVVGLNVSKRILQVHNPLCLKVVFNEKPSGESFRKFVEWLRCTSMQKLDNPGLPWSGFTYRAQVRKIAAFDRACKAKSIRFGHLKATITPLYNFAQCPYKLDTPYKETQKKKDKDKNISNDTQKTGDIKQGNKSTDNVTNKISDSTESNKTVAATVNKKTIESTNKDNKTTVKSNTLKPIVNPPAANKPQQRNEEIAKKTPPKPNPVKATATTSLNESKDKTAFTKELTNVEKTVIVKENPSVGKTVAAKQSPTKKASVTENSIAATVAAKNPKITTSKDSTEVVKAEASKQNQNVTKPVTTKVNPSAVKAVATKQNPNTVAAKVAPVRTENTPQVNTATKPSAANAKSTPTKVVSNKNGKTVAVKLTSTADAKSTPAKVVTNQSKENNATTPAVAKNTPAKVAANKMCKVAEVPTSANKVNATAKPATAPAKSEPTKVIPHKNGKAVPVAANINKVNTSTKPTVTKSTPTKVAPNKNDKAKGKIENKGNDFDELDDEDILALMSNAIVLDECSGSEDES